MCRRSEELIHWCSRDNRTGFSTPVINPGTGSPSIDFWSGHSLFQRRTGPGAGDSQNVDYMLNRCVVRRRTFADAIAVHVPPRAQVKALRTQATLSGKAAKHTSVSVPDPPRAPGPIAGDGMKSRPPDKEREQTHNSRDGKSPIQVSANLTGVLRSGGSQDRGSAVVSASLKPLRETPPNLSGLPSLEDILCWPSVGLTSPMKRCGATPR